METYTQKLIKNLNIQLNSIDSLEESLFTKAPKAIILLENLFVELKTFISSYSFKDIEEETYFFKEIKPQLFSKLVYYRKIYNIESLRPNGSLDSHKAHLKKELDHIKTFFDFLHSCYVVIATTQYTYNVFTLYLLLVKIEGGN